MALYVPGTEETDLKKIIMSAQLVAGQTTTNTDNIATVNTTLSAMRAAWAAYTPAITAGTGTLTTVSAVGRYLTIGKTTFISATITITTNGTGASYIIMTLPNTTAAATQYLNGATGTGNSLNVNLGSGSANALIFKYDGTYPGGSGVTLSASGCYENA